MAEAAEDTLAHRRTVVVVATANQATARAQFENMCRAKNVRVRLSAEVGRRSTAVVLDLRGAPENLAEVGAQFDAYVAAQAMVPAPPGMSRAVIGAISFLVGLAGTLALFMAATQGASR